MSSRLRLALCGILIAPAAVATEVKPIEDSEVCRAAIGSVMGRDPKTMKALKGGDATIVAYFRPSDGSVWTYKCRLEGNRVNWGSADGRWRTHPDDGVLTFEVVDSGKKVRILEKHSDGSMSQETYDRKNLR